MKELRGYQVKGIDQLAEKINKCIKKVIFWLQTGGGKSLIMAEIARRNSDNNIKTLVVMRRKNLVNQCKKTFEIERNLDCGIIMAGHEVDESKNIQICSIDTIRSRIDKLEFLKTYEYVIVDEAHDTTSNTYLNFFDFLGDKIFVGFTSTPYKTGDKYLSFWDDFVKPIKPIELVNIGHLCPLEIYCDVREKINVDGVKKTGGDFNQKKLYEKVKEQTNALVGNIVKEYNRLAQGKKGILFAINIRHSIDICNQLNAHGIKARHCDAKSTIQERVEIINQLRSGEIDIITNCDIFSTGIDIPELEVAIMARPTMSKNLFLQQAGRVLRTCLGKKKAILIDHAGNCLEHGSPFDEHDPEITFVDNSKKMSKIREKLELKAFSCPSCHFVFAKSEFCPKCGEVVKEAADLPDQIDRELKAYIDDNTLRVIRKTLEEKNRLARSLNYHTGWKYYQILNQYGEDAIRFSDKLKIPDYAISKFLKNKK